MDIVSQITVKVVGEPKRKEFAVEDLDEAVSEDGSKRKHVTLHPADYISVWKPDNPESEDPTPIQIPDSVSVTIMPGAIVEYFESEDLGDRGFRLESFLVENSEGGEQTFAGEPFAPPGTTQSNHPLHHSQGDSLEDYASRYKYPNFTGAVENIADLNLASDWAFKQEFERDLWSVKGKEPGDEGGRQTVNNAIPFRGTVNYVGGNKVYIENEDLEGEDVGAKVTVNHTEYKDQDWEIDGTVENIAQSSLTVNGAEYIATENTSFQGGISSVSDLSQGDRVGISFFVNGDNDNEMEILEKGYNDFRNQNTTELIQSLTVEDGHVLGAETFTLKDRINPATDSIIDIYENGGNLVVEHAATGFVDGNGNPITAPSIPTDPENGPDPEQGFSVSLRALETDDRGHLTNIEYAPNVEKVVGGRGIGTNHLEPGSPGTFEVSFDPSKYNTGKNISISDGSGQTVDVSLSNSINRETRSSDPNDPAQGEAVTWVSDGTDSGDAGDVMVKVNVGGTVKQGTLFDFSAA